MLNSSSFIESDLKEAEALFNKVQYSPRQRKLLTELASVIHKYIPVSELALRGFLLRAAKEYQITHKKTLLDIENETKETRYQAMKTGFSLVEKYLTRILKDPTQKELVSKALQDALDYYVKNYT